MLSIRSALVCCVLPFIGAACAGAEDTDVVDHHEQGEEQEDNLGTTASPLVAADPVSSAVAQSCSTTAVKALALQLVQEINCMKPGSMRRIDNTPGLALGSAVFPYLQSPAATALIAAQKVRGVTLSINSGLRTLPQQYLLYRWYQTGRCGIRLAASPGTSNHESAISLDIDSNASWRSAMASKNYRWLGAGDPVHFDYVGGGTINMKGLSVLAFQRLWNRNHPADKITEDGDYGPATGDRLASSPVGGFAIGATCKDPMMMPATEAPPPATAADEAPSVPDATEPTSESTSDSVQPLSDEKTTTSATLTAPRVGAVEQGCAVSRAPASSGGVALSALLGVMFAFCSRRGRRAAQA